jgi:hypothetical protein
MKMKKKNFLLVSYGGSVSCQDDSEVQMNRKRKLVLLSRNPLAEEGATGSELKLVHVNVELD